MTTQTTNPIGGFCGLCFYGEKMNKKIVTECIAEKDLPPEVAREIQDLQHVAFPSVEEFASRRWWHTPLVDDDLWFLARVDGQIAGNVKLNHRRIIVAGCPIRIGGIGNVCSHPTARGMGLAKVCMQAAQNYMAGNPKIDFGFLFCGKPVLDFYLKLGWVDINNAMTYINADGNRATGCREYHGHTMIYPAAMKIAQWRQGTIDLNGPDW